MSTLAAMEMPVGTVLPEIVLILGAVLVLVFALFAPRRRQGWSAWLALAALAATAAVTAPMLDDPQGLTFFDTYAVDGIALWGKLLVLAVTALTVLLSLPWFRGEPREGEYYALLLLSALGALVLAAAADLMEIVLGVLLSSVTGYVLAAYHRASARSGEAALKYYLLGALTNAGLFYGVVLLFGLAGTTTLPGLDSGLAEADPVALVPAAALVVVGLAFKLGAAPAHAWVPNVADGAPAPVAAFLTAAPKIGALIAIARLADALPEQLSGWRALLAVLSAVTMTLGNLAALWQDDLRRLLGWSAVSQAGYALMAVVALGRSELAVPALLYFLLAYALGNLAAFAVVVELRGRAQIASYAGLAAAHPALAAVLAVAMLSFVGIPPLAGFTGKLALFGAAMDAGYTWLAVLAVVNSVVSLAYYLRVLAPVYFDRPAQPVPVLAAVGAAAAVLSAAGVVLAGIAAGPLLEAFARAQLAP